MSKSIVSRRYGAAKIFASALIAATFLCGWTASFAQSYTMKIGMVTINDPIHAVAVQYGKEVERRSGGRIKAEVYPAGQLGKASRQIEGLQAGTQEVLVSPPAFLAGITPGVQVLDAPGFFRSMDHAYNVVTRPAFREHLLNSLIDQVIQNDGITTNIPLRLQANSCMDRADGLDFGHIVFIEVGVRDIPPMPFLCALGAGNMFIGREKAFYLGGFAQLIIELVEANRQFAIDNTL